MSEDNQHKNVEADTTLGEETISTSATAAAHTNGDIPSTATNNNPLMSYFDSDKTSEEEEVSSDTKLVENTNCKDDTTVGIAKDQSTPIPMDNIPAISSLEEVNFVSNDTTSNSTPTPAVQTDEVLENAVKTENSTEINDSSNTRTDKTTEDDISTTSTTEDFHTPREELTPRISEPITPTSTTVQPSSPDRISENDNTTIQQNFSDSPERTAQIEIVHSPPPSSSSVPTTSTDVGKERKDKEAGQEKKRESITDVDHSQSKLQPSSTANDKSIENTSTENDNNIVQTAEKQAAIAAAISANMSSSMSPSVAAGIAKAWMSDKVTKVTGTEINGDVMSISNSLPGNPNYPPPPPPRKGQGVGTTLPKQYNNNSPTMVALPPPTPLTGSPNSRNMPMRPVRFEDVKFSFCKLLKGDEEEKFDTPRGDDGVVDKVVDNKMDGIKKAEGGTDSNSGEDNEDNTKSVAEETVEDPKTEPIDEGEGEEPKVDGEGSEISTAAVASDESPILSDSFLRFLLIVARVPIIVEEHKKPQSTSQIEHTENAAATSAAGRAFELLCMILSSYELISNSQQQSTDDSVKRMDATTSFFAACSGLEKIASDSDSLVDDIDAMKINSGGGSISSAVPVPPLPLIGKDLSSSPRRTSASTTSTTGGTSSLTTSASSMASSVFSNVISKMAMPKKQTSFTDIGKKLTSSMSSPNPPNVKSISSPDSHPKGLSSPSSLQSSMHHKSGDYECLIDNEMLGLTVENVLERTIIRTLLPDGAAKHAGAQVGSLIAKVGNVDTSNLTHFETIDELRRSQRPLKLTLRHIGGDTLRKAREEMGRLIRGHGLATIVGGRNSTTSGSSDSRPWRDNNQQQQQQTRQPVGETFDIVLNNRWPSRSNKSLLVSGASASAPPLAMTRAESMHQASKNLIRILALLIVGMDNELKEIESASIDDSRSTIARPHLTVKELKESIEITSKILLDYARSQPDVDDRRPYHNANAGGKVQPPSSSFYPVPPGRVKGKQQHGPPNAGRGGRGGRGQRGKKPSNSSLLRVGDALQRTRSFLVESNSTSATALRWEIIDYLCVILDLDTEQELSESESESSTEGGGSPINDLGAAGSILKLIVLNCSTIEEIVTPVHSEQDGNNSDSESSSLDQSLRSTVGSSTSGNPFLSVVHRLAASKSTSARVSACSLGPVLWSHLDFPRQLQLRGVITRALHDVEVIVRKSTAAVLHEIAELVFDRRAVPWLVLMCERSMTDPEPQLRAAAMTLTWHLAEHLPNAFLGDASKGSRSIRRLPPRDSPTFMDVYLLQCKLLPVANNLAEDKIASVRLSVAAQCDRLCNALGEHWFNIIIDLLLALLSDADDRVRSEAILCMPRLVESVIIGTSDNGNITVLESLLPLAVKLQRDTSAMVRSALAAATGELLIFLVGLGNSGPSSHINEPPSPGRVGSITNEPSSPGRAEISPLQPPPSPGRSGLVLYAEHKKHVDDTLIPILQKLLQDSDPEVTTASLRAVTNASRSGTRDSTRIPSHAAHIDDDLVSLSSHHSHQSHASFERTKPVFIPVLSENQVLRLLPTLANLATSPQWRVRQSAVEIVPALMGCTHRQETRHEISKLCLRLMNDKVDAVRKTAAECLCLGGSSLARHGVEDTGGEWIKMIVIPHLRTCSQSEDSKQRLLSLKMIQIIITNGLCPRVSADEASSTASPQRHDDDESTNSSIITETERPIRTLLNIAGSLTNDAIPNIRLNVGRVLESIMLLLDRPDIDFAVEILEKQLEEETSLTNPDRDVIFFAQSAITIASPLRRQSSLISA